MGRVAASGSLNMYDVRATLGVTPSYDLGSHRRGGGVGSTPTSGEISFGHMYGAFTLGPATIGTVPTSTYTGSYLASTSPVPAGLGGSVTNPGQGYYTNTWSNLTGGAGQTITCPSGENLRTYCRIMNYQVPWGSFFDAASSSGLGIGHGSSTWPGSISYINGIWFSWIGSNAGGSYYNNVAIATIKSTSDYAGAIWSDGGTVYFGQLNAAQFATGTFSATWSGAMYNVGSFARNSQCNMYYRWGGTGITSLTYQYNQIGYRGFGYNHDTAYVGPGSQSSPNNYAFLKIGGVTAPGSFNGPGGGTVIG